MIVQLLQLGAECTLLVEIMIPLVIHHVKCLILLQIPVHLLFLIRKIRSGFQAVTIGTKLYVSMGG